MEELWSRVERQNPRGADKLMDMNMNAKTNQSLSFRLFPVLVVQSDLETTGQLDKTLHGEFVLNEPFHLLGLWKQRFVLRCCLRTG